MKINSMAVIGLGFGDEGKGKVVSCLSLQHNTKPLIVRFCGGQQAGHHVIHKTFDHVFSNFSSGTMLGCPTYWI